MRRYIEIDDHLHVILYADLEDPIGKNEVVARSEYREAVDAKVLVLGDVEGYRSQSEGKIVDGWSVDDHDWRYEYVVRIDPATTISVPLEES